jgi:hypothetical protein
MPVTVDSEILHADELGLRTVGQVLAHVQKDSRRLIVQVLIDGQEPHLDALPALRQSLVGHRTVYIETADPREMACDVLAQVRQQLDEANQFRADTVALLQQNQPVKALERLGACFSTWQHAQEAVQKTAQLLRIDLTQIHVDGRPLQDLLEGFADQLRQIKSALENRDFVLLADILTYEATETCAQWQSAVQVMLAAVAQR